MAKKLTKKQQAMAKQYNQGFVMLPSVQSGTPPPIQHIQSGLLATQVWGAGGGWFNVLSTPTITADLFQRYLTYLTNIYALDVASTLDGPEASLVFDSAELELLKQA